MVSPDRGGWLSVAVVIAVVWLVVIAALLMSVGHPARDLLRALAGPRPLMLALAATLTNCVNAWSVDLYLVILGVAATATVGLVISVAVIDRLRH